MTAEIASPTIHVDREQRGSELDRYRTALDAHRMAYAKQFIALQLSEFTPDSWEIANPFADCRQEDIDIQNGVFVVGGKELNIRLTKEGDFESKSKENAWYKLKTRGMFQRVLQSDTGIHIAEIRSEGTDEVVEAKERFQKGQFKLAQEYIGRQIGRLGVARNVRKSTFIHAMRSLQVNDRGDISFDRQNDEPQIISSDKIASHILGRIADGDVSIPSRKQERREMMKKVGEASLYGGSFILGFLTMAGAAHVVKDASVLRAGAMMVNLFAVAARAQLTDMQEGMKNVKGTKTYKRISFARTVAGIAVSFLWGATGETIAEAMGMENPVSQATHHDALGKHTNIRISESHTPSTDTSVTPESTATQVAPETSVAPLPESNTLYLNTGAGQIDMHELVSNPRWAEMKQQLDMLPQWKQDLVVDWSSHFMNHVIDGQSQWIEPKEWMVKGLQQIIDVPDLKTYSEVVRPALNTLSTSHIPQPVH